MFYWSYRCLCWDHVSSLAFENITQNSLPAPMSSRSMYIYQLAVLCREMFVEHSAGRRIGRGSVVAFIKHMVLRSIFKATFMYTDLHHYWNSVNRPPTLAQNPEIMRPCATMHRPSASTYIAVLTLIHLAFASIHNVTFAHLAVVPKAAASRPALETS